MSEAKKKKKPKKKTYNRFWNSIISGMRTSFSRYSPKYEEVTLKRRVEKERLNKNGSISKKKDVWYTCDLCGIDHKKNEINVDHIEPVVEIGKTSKDYTLDQYLSRLDCDIDNLSVICVGCHSKKTEQENQARKLAKSNNKKKE